MGEPERESLIVLTRGVDPAEVISLAGGRVTQRLAERIALAVLPPSARNALAQRSAVVNVYDDDVPDDVKEHLGDDERLFVDAWCERARTKQRKADGLSWDAPGFEAP